MTVHASAQQGFSRQAEAYERGRPAYPRAATDWLIADLGLAAGRSVVDVGSISFIAALEDERRAAVLDQVRALASRHPEPWAYVTEAYVYERVDR